MSSTDLLELESLVKLCTRQYSKTVLADAITELKAQLAPQVPKAPPDENSDVVMTSSETPPPAQPVVVAPTRSLVSSPMFISIDTFALDVGGYNSPTLTIYVTLKDVGSIKSNVTCTFTKKSFDLKVIGLEGKSYRLVKDNLEHDINVDSSKFVVKADKVIIKLGKVKGEYSFDSWSQLSAKKTKKEGEKKADPQDSIMDLMKGMYDDGDDNMKKIIGEAMLKNRNGEKSEPGIPKFDDDKMDDFGGDDDGM